MTKKLLVIIPDRLSVLIQKGEVVPRYYNPGDFFDEVHILMMNDDEPDKSLVQPMVGSAKLFLYNYPEPHGFFKKTLGWQPFLMKKWVEGAVDVIKEVRPNLMRCYGFSLHAYLAMSIKKTIKIPLLLSLHTDLDRSSYVACSFKQKIIHFFLSRMEKKVYEACDLVLPVYESILPYLKKRKIKHYKVCYNFLSDAYLEKKETYDVGSPVQALCVGRQLKGKEPFHIISALKEIEGILLTLVGDGDDHEKLKQHAADEGVIHKTRFIKRLSNEDLCKSLKNYDFMVLNTHYYELSKVMLESFLVGLPLIVNKPSSKEAIPELSHDRCLMVDDSPLGYLNGMQKLIQDGAFRESLGKHAYKIAQEKWSPLKSESVYEKIYKEYCLS